ncbi:MAG: VCBS repeat-containing protein [Phycisphaerae bacterium]|nr:VCBS repeat-containing protein [Phycisphaerae bacterium]
MKQPECIAITMLILLAASVVDTPALADDAEFVLLMNRGKALIENRDSVKAVETIEAALRLCPDSAVALRNLARAALIAGLHEKAISALTEAAKIDPMSSSTPYLHGLVLARDSRFEDAVPFFEAATKLDAVTPAVRFQLALAYQATGRDDAAGVQFRETVRLDPMHAAAWFKLAAYARQAGEVEEARRCTLEFTRLRKLFGDQSRNAESLESCIHTRPEAIINTLASVSARRTTTQPATSSPNDPDAASAAPIKVRFVDATSTAFSGQNQKFASMAILDTDDAGRPGVAMVTDQGGIRIARWSKSAGFELQSVDLTLDDLKGVKAVVVGDYHNDVPKGEKYDARSHARNDLLLIHGDGLTLLRQSGRGTFVDVTDRSGLRGVRAESAVWADIDHDGDLDLVLACRDGARIFQNNGNETFKDVSGEVGMPQIEDCERAAAVDLDRNDAIDLILIRGHQPTVVIENRRAGQFARMVEPPGPWPAANRILADDLNLDGNIDIVLLGADRAEIIDWGTPARGRLDYAGFDACDTALVDWDNDGQIDIVISGKSEGEGAAIRGWRNDGNGGFSQAPAGFFNIGTQQGHISQILSGDFDGDGDTDLLALTRDGSPIFLRNDGGNANRQIKVRLLAQKTNPSGFGTHVEVRVGRFFTSREVTSPAIEIGVGARDRLDLIQTIWTNGVVDNQLDIQTASAPFVILEKNVATGSCPFLYAWDGAGFRFVTDILGNAPIGLPLTRQMLLPADPEEIVLIGNDESLRATNNRFVLEITSEFLEVLYMDDVELLAVDHPPGAEVHSTDKIMIPPFPPSEIRLLQHRRSPILAMGDDGIDRTQAMEEIDGRFAPPGALLPPPYRGMCRPLVLTLDFGEPIDASGSIVLALTGWLQYGQGSTNIALSQNPDALVSMPKLEVEMPDGGWRVVDVDVGMPAGKTKTILVDLDGKVPPAFRRLRLTNTFEIRWDRLALFESVPLSRNVVRSSRPDSAQLRWRGFSDLRARAQDHPTTPDYDQVSPVPMWRSNMYGWCTRYGDVLELVSARDGALVLANGGDALRLEFDADDFAPVAPGMTRTYFLRSYGWEKDGDHNVVGGDSIDPLPPGARQGDWILKYNTRWSAGDRYRRSGEHSAN